MASPKYTPLLAREPIDDNETRPSSPSSPRMRLLTSPTPTTTSLPAQGPAILFSKLRSRFSSTSSSPYTLTFPLVPHHILRFLASVLALPAAIVLVTDGHKPFIAAIIFLFCMLAWNILHTLYTLCSSFLRIEISVRRDAIALPVSSTSSRRTPVVKVGLRNVVDVTISLAALLGLVIGFAIKMKQRWHGSGPWQAAVVVGYVAVGFQTVVAMPGVDGLGMRVTVRVGGGDEQRDGESHDVLGVRDVKRAVVVGDEERGLVGGEGQTTGVVEGEQRVEGTDA